MRSRWVGRWTGYAIALGWGAVLLTAGPAQAHTALIGSSPKKNATLQQPPATVVLQFTEPVTDLGVAVQVTGPGGRVEAGEPKLAGAAVGQDLRAGLPAGKYTVVYRVTSDDGHPIEGTFAFTATEAGAGAGTTPASPSAAPSGESSPAATTPVALPVATPAADAGGDGVSPTWYVVGVTIVVAGLLAAAAAMALPRRRPSGADRPGPPSD